MSLKFEDSSTDMESQIPEEEQTALTEEEKIEAHLVPFQRELTPEEIIKKDIKSLESQAKHSKNPMEQRQLRQKIGKLQMKLKYKDFGLYR